MILLKNLHKIEWKVVTEEKVQAKKKENEVFLSYNKTKI